MVKARVTERSQLAAAAGAALFGLISSGVILAGDRPVLQVAPLAAINPATAAKVASSQLILAHADPENAGAVCEDPRFRALATRSAIVEPLLGDALAAVALAKRCESYEAFAAAARASEKIDRRNGTLQALQLDEQSRRRDQEAALATMRRMIITRPHLSDRIVPLLGQTVRDEESLTSVIKLVEGQLPWKRAFLRHAAASFTPEQILRVRQAYGAADPDLESIDKEAVATLARRGELEAAWSYYTLAAPDDVAARQSRLLARDDDYRPFGWEFTPSRQLQVRSSGVRGELLQATLRLGAAGTMAIQVFPAENASYRFSMAIEERPGATATAQVRCLSPLGEGAKWRTLSDGELLNPATLDDNCRFAAIKLDAVSSDTTRRHNITVQSVELTRVR